MQISQQLRTILGAALLLAAGSAAAQYVWLDANGKRTYSDRPPPPDVPAARVLQAPKGMQQIMAVAAEPAGVSATPSAPSTSTLAQREADFQKRRQEGAEKAQKTQAELAQAAERKRGCESAMRAKAQLESGARLQSHKSVDPHEVMSDAERATELARANKLLAACR